jgi:hypothetical protein
VGYEFTDKVKNWGFNVGVDYMTNLADSDGIQAAYRAVPGVNNQLTKRVPGVAIHGKLDLGPYALVAEYIGATTAFDAADVSVNNVGAKPQALHIAGIYQYTGLWNRSSELAIGYNSARDTQAFNIPKTRWNLTHSIVILKNTIFGLEYRRDQNYDAGTTTIQGNRVTNASIGGYTNTLTAQLTYLF